MFVRPGSAPADRRHRAGKAKGIAIPAWPTPTDSIMFGHGEDLAALDARDGHLIHLVRDGWLDPVTEDGGLMIGAGDDAVWLDPQGRLRAPPARAPGYRVDVAGGCTRIVRRDGVIAAELDGEYTLAISAQVGGQEQLVLERYVDDRLRGAVLLRPHSELAP